MLFPAKGRGQTEAHNQLDTFEEKQETHSEQHWNQEQGRKLRFLNH